MTQHVAACPSCGHRVEIGVGSEPSLFITALRAATAHNAACRPSRPRKFEDYGQVGNDD